LDYISRILIQRILQILMETIDGDGNGRKIKLNYMHQWFNGKDAMYAVCSYEGDTNNVRRVIPGFFALIGFIIFLNYILNKVIWYVCSI
nr:hypothetical protein [Thermoproteota archaeon]